MKFKLSAYTIHEQGPRDRQEDSLFPAHNGTQKSDRLFMVCDGMGGHSAGDIASSTVCSALSGHILANVADAEGEFSDDNFKAALEAAYNTLDTKDDGSPKKMGTTMTFLKFHKNGYTIAHIGDSRVYHIRPGVDAESTEILFQTQDHSLVNDLVRIGELTPEEAKTSKQRNVITRAMQPNMERRSRADIAHANDIRPGDYFMLCSDGILEQMEDDNIKFIFSEKGGDAERKVDMLIKVTENNHDNHTAILVRVDDVELAADEVIIPYAKPVVMTPIIEEEPIVLEPDQDVDYVSYDHENSDYDNKDEESNDNGMLAKIRPYMVPTIIVLGITAFGIFAYNFMTKSDDSKQVKETIIVVREDATTPDVKGGVQDAGQSYTATSNEEQVPALTADAGEDQSNINSDQTNNNEVGKVCVDNQATDGKTPEDKTSEDKTSEGKTSEDKISDDKTSDEQKLSEQSSVDDEQKVSSTTTDSQVQTDGDDEK